MIPLWFTIILYLNKYVLYILGLSFKDFYVKIYKVISMFDFILVGKEVPRS